MNSTVPWSLKYAPTDIDDMVLEKNVKDMLKGIMASRKMSNLSLIGKPGVGKTTIAKILMNSLDCDTLFQPCSIDGSIDMVKTKIKNFTEIIPRGDYKLIVLDEADQLSQQAQMALRNIICENADTCRFILTANYKDKLIDALLSRCPAVDVEFSSKEILVRCISILKAENVSFDRESLQLFYRNVIERRYPDIRSVVEMMQLMCSTGKLNVEMADKMTGGIEIVNYIRDNINLDIRTLRTAIITNEDKFSGDYVKLAEGLFNAYPDNAEVMLVISEYLYRMSSVLDKEIQFTGMLINIKNIMKGK